MYSKSSAVVVRETKVTLWIWIKLLRKDFKGRRQWRHVTLKISSQISTTLEFIWVKGSLIFKVAGLLGISIDNALEIISNFLVEIARLNLKKSNDITSWFSLNSTDVNSKTLIKRSRSYCYGKMTKNCILMNLLNRILNWQYTRGLNIK